MNIPESLKYTRDHLWVQVKNDIVYIGLTDYAQTEIGNIIYVDVNSLGENLEKYRTFGSVESAYKVVNLILPFSAVIMEFNGELDKYPSLINDDPYGAGWIIKAELDDIAETQYLMNSQQYKDYLDSLGDTEK